MNKNLKFFIFFIRFLLTESPNSLSFFRNMFNSQKLSDATKTTESILHQLIEYQPINCQSKGNSNASFGANTSRQKRKKINFNDIPNR